MRVHAEPATPSKLRPACPTRRIFKCRARRSGNREAPSSRKGRSECKLMASELASMARSRTEDSWSDRHGAISLDHRSQFSRALTNGMAGIQGSRCLAKRRRHHCGFDIGGLVPSDLIWRVSGRQCQVECQCLDGVLDHAVCLAAQSWFPTQGWNGASATSLRISL